MSAPKIKNEQTNLLAHILPIISHPSLREGRRFPRVIFGVPRRDSEEGATDGRKKNNYRESCEIRMSDIQGKSGRGSAVDCRAAPVKLLMAAAGI
jgi:hypothetical protein